MRRRALSGSSSIVLQPIESSLHWLTALRLPHLQEGHLSQRGWRPGLCPTICPLLWALPGKMKAGHRADAPFENRTSTVKMATSCSTLPKAGAEREEALASGKGPLRPPADVTVELRVYQETETTTSREEFGKLEGRESPRKRRASVGWSPRGSLLPTGPTACQHFRACVTHTYPCGPWPGANTALTARERGR